MFIDSHSKFHNEINNQSALLSKIYLLTSLLIERLSLISFFILLNNFLPRKQNCPQCRAVVLKEDLIKLFLEDNPSACVQNNTIEQELNTLK